ncbi:hypothetical protein [Bacillus sp. EAC]|uniref:BclA C-terminal domain-containing protein n=1 Tax=Bacillus sp. EAC TaxID=1978338 RepID=UPI000B438B7D|nr:hypothetical protein [Bacillus sp. EAC]
MHFGRHLRPPKPFPPGEDFAQVTNSGGVIAVLNEGTKVTFPSFEFLGEAIIINEAKDRLTVFHPGNYYIAYSVNTTIPTKVSTAILINGRRVSATTIAPVENRTEYNNQIILPLEEGDTISLELFGIVGTVTLLAGAGASLSVFKIS